MTLVVNGSGLTIEDVVRVARHGEKVELHPDSIKKDQFMPRHAREKS